MKILFASPDRDLLSAYGILLSDGNNEVEKAFDGTFVLSKIEDGKPDLMILSYDVPRVDSVKIQQLCKDRQIPVILLLDQKPKNMTAVENASEYLIMPFSPRELNGVIKKVMSKEGGRT